MKNVIIIEKLKEEYRKHFDGEAQFFYSAPGRTELSGNHTDHQHGKVLAASIDLESRAAVALNDSDVITIMSEGHDIIKVSLDDLSIKNDEAGKATSLVRGIAFKFKELGYKLKGFNAYINSNVLVGSGLSSSAAFEVLIANIFKDLCDANIDAIEIAKISQFSENVYFKKPCGLMDQMASSVGNSVFIDFKDTDKPIVEKIDFDFSKCGYTLCVIDSGADHIDLTDEYSSITDELKRVSSVFGKKWVLEIDENDFLSNIKEVEKKCGDRAVIRALHIFAENKRVIEQVEALKNNDFEKYLSLMRESGRSSWMYLQNVVPCGNSDKQELGFAIALCERLLGEKGVCRVHGGGFAGTLQAFVKNDYVAEFKKSVEKVLGEDSCHILNILPVGGRKL